MITAKPSEKFYNQNLAYAPWTICISKPE